MLLHSCIWQPPKKLFLLIQWLTTLESNYGGPLVPINTILEKWVPPTSIVLSPRDGVQKWVEKKMHKISQCTMNEYHWKRGKWSKEDEEEESQRRMSREDPLALEHGSKNANVEMQKRSGQKYCRERMYECCEYHLHTDFIALYSMYWTEAKESSRWYLHLWHDVTICLYHYPNMQMICKIWSTQLPMAVIVSNPCL